MGMKPLKKKDGAVLPNLQAK